MSIIETMVLLNKILAPSHAVPEIIHQMHFCFENSYSISTNHDLPFKNHELTWKSLLHFVTCHFIGLPVFLSAYEVEQAHQEGFLWQTISVFHIVIVPTRRFLMTVTVKMNLQVLGSEDVNNTIINYNSKLKVNSGRVGDRDSAETMCCFTAFTTVIFSALCCNGI